MKNSTLEKVISCINSKRSFIVEAGAGSGKTWSLIESLKHILGNYSDELRKNNQKIVCITYTNVAADEISKRIEYNPLVSVQTIHKYLWSVIKNYQAEIKSELIFSNKTESKEPIEDLENIIKAVEITYSEYGKNYQEGEIFHDDVIKFSGRIFKKYPKLIRIVVSQFPYIFVDEYQDTEPDVVTLLLDNLLEKNIGILTVGFFGDSMQKIYNKGVGRINSEKLEIITKEENYRCSHAVISLLNKIRSNIQQKAAGKNLEGKISFFHCNSRLSDNQHYQTVVNHLHGKCGWALDVKSSKVLMLTHKGIAGKLDYANLLDVYTKRYSFGREKLYEKEDRFSDFLFNKIERLCFLYEEKMYGEFVSFIGKEKCRLNKHSDKKKMQQLMDGLNQTRSTGKINDVLNYIFANKIFSKPSKISDFEKRINQNNLDERAQKDKAFYEILMSVPYQEVINLNQYIEDNTPFSTKHGVKGTEYNNVLVVIDDRAWNQYNFNYVFCNSLGKGQFERTLNLLYVCCSRAKDKLAVLSLSKVDPAGLQKIEDWFGKENVHDVVKL